jgi:hypothetical protein
MMPVKFSHKRLGAILGVVFLVSVSAQLVIAAFAPSCASQPREAWLSSYEIGLRLQSRGFELVRLRIGTERCVDVVAKDKTGRFVDLLVNPFNAEIVRVGGQ